MKKRTSSKVGIYYGDSLVCEATILQTSIRKQVLMKEDYVRLDFVLDRALPMRIGSHIEDEIFGKFILRKEQMPTWVPATGGWQYQLQFDAEYMHLEDSRYMLTVDKESQTEKGILVPVRDSVEFSLTADLFGQIESWLNSAVALGYDIVFDKETDTSFPEEIEPYEVELMQYSNIGMISALYDICNKWGVECWFEATETGYRLKLGKCELGDEPLILEQGVNVASMRISDGRKTYANRIYAFGGKDNIAYDYRRKVQNNVVKWYDANFPGTDKPHFTVFELENNTKAFKNAMVTANFFVEEDGTLSGNYYSWPKTTDTEYDMQWLKIKTTNMRFETWTDAFQNTAPYLDYEVDVTFILKRKKNGTLYDIGTKTVKYTGRAKRGESYHLYYMQSGHIYTDFDVEAGTIPDDEELHHTTTNSDTCSYKISFTDSPREVFSEDYTVKSGSIYVDASWSLKLKENGTQVYSHNSVGMERSDVRAYVRYHFYHTVGDWAMFKTIDDTGAERKIRTVYIKYYADINAITSNSVHAVLTDGSSTDNDGKGYYVIASSPIVEWNGTAYDSATFSASELVDILYEAYSGTDSGEVTTPRRFAFDSDDPDIPSALFTTPYDDPSSVLRVGEQRLRMPQDFGDFVETEESASDPSKRIEACVIFDKVFPKLRLYVKEVLSVAETEEQQYEAEDESAYWKYHQFFVKLAFIGGSDIDNTNFDETNVLDGETLRIKFVTPRDFDRPDNNYQGKLSGMTFELKWMPSGTYYSAGEGQTVHWGETGCFKVIRNDTFGAKLPNDDLKVTQGDYCTLIGINLRKFQKTSMYTTAEEELKEKALAYLNALQEGNFTFENLMLAGEMRHYGIDANEPLAGPRVFAFYLPSPTSGNTDRLYVGRKVRILNDALPTKTLVPRSTTQLTEDDFSEFLFGMYISSEKILVRTGERVEVEMLGIPDNVFLWNGEDEETVIAGEGSLVYENTSYNDVEFYVGLGRVQKFLASLLEDYAIDGWGTQWSAPEPVVLNPGRTITIQSSVPTALVYYKSVEGEWEEFIVGGTEESTQWTNNEGEPIEVWVGTKDTAADLWLYVDSIAQGVRANYSRYVGTKDSRVIGVELKMDCPEDGAKYTIGETEAFSRLAKIEKELSNK